MVQYKNIYCELAVEFLPPVALCICGVKVSVLGINDSHDSGAALVHNGQIVTAVNEERFTKRKNDVGFPNHSVLYATGRSDGEVDAVALAWIGGNALVSRVIPSWDRKRLMMWKRQLPKQSRASMHVANVIYRATQNQRPRWLWRATSAPISRYVTRNRLRGNAKGKLAGKDIYLVEHHLAHAASAYYTSGFDEALILTLDGAGDGLSGTVSIGDKGEIKRLAEFRASASLGILYGAAALACDLRFAEDEGKLMSLAAYAYPKKVHGISDICVYDPKTKQFVSKVGTRNEFLLAEHMRDNILSRTDRESFAYAVQRHAELQVISLLRHWIRETKIHRVALAGGLFSNVIINMQIEHLPEVKNLFVFPHMGDGGLSLGAAAYIDFMLNSKLRKTRIDSVYLGPSYSDAETLNALKGEAGIKYQRVSDAPRRAAEMMIDSNSVVLWFQGAMEYGPRALGNRSVLMLPNDPENRNILNSTIKRRPYYQPFASTILEEDAPKLLENYKITNRFMTSANVVRDDRRDDLSAASHIDHTTRPQVLGQENKMYRELIKRVRRGIGVGAVLNTSLNRHRFPIVMSPKDAVWTLKNTGADVLFAGNYVVEKTKG